MTNWKIVTRRRDYVLEKRGGVSTTFSMGDGENMERDVGPFRDQKAFLRNFHANRVNFWG